MAEVDYKKRCEEYEKRMGIGEDDPAKDGYLVLVKILKQQNEYLKNVSIKTMIIAEDKKAEYERAKALWEKLPNIIQAVGDLKIQLKMDGEEKKNIYKPISARTMAEEEEDDV